MNVHSYIQRKLKREQTCMMALVDEKIRMIGGKERKERKRMK
jgi:hypothetical protein